MQDIKLLASCSVAKKKQNYLTRKYYIIILLFLVNGR